MKFFNNYASRLKLSLSLNQTLFPTGQLQCESFFKHIAYKGIKRFNHRHCNFGTVWFSAFFLVVEIRFSLVVSGVT